MLTVILGGVNMGQHLFGGVLTHTVLTVFQRWNESAVRLHSREPGTQSSAEKKVEGFDV